jgi:hypothetical protein
VGLGKGGVVCGNALIGLRQLPTVIFHRELDTPTRNRKGAIGLRQLAVLRGLAFRGGALLVVVLIFTHIFGSSGILGSEDEQNP